MKGVVNLLRLLLLFHFDLAYMAPSTGDKNKTIAICFDYIFAVGLEQMF